MKKSYALFIALLFLFFKTALSQSVYYVSPNGSSSNDGSDFSSPMDLFTALDVAQAGDEIILYGATYYIPYVSGEKNTIEFSKSGSSGNYITLRAADNTIATVDFSFPDMAWVQDSYGFYVTGDYWYFKGLKITHAGYQGAYVTGGNNTFENCTFYDNRNTGLEINKGGNNTTVINCDSYYNYDPKKGGSMADGFGPKQTQGSGNIFVGCRSWNNSDDGYDCYDSPEVVIFENCWAFNNGIDVWQFDGALEFAGNGNGFKVGGNYVLANNVLKKCVSFGHPNKGFDQNNNTGGLTFYNCTAYSNGTNFGLGNDVASGESHILKNNISLNGPNSLLNTTEANNSWNSGFSVSSSDFVSLDLSLATVSRNSDGSLPETNLFRLNPQSSLIDAGVNVGLPYSGAAPDLGAFEYEETNSGETVITLQEENAGFCGVDGVIESDHAGYTGSGYANTDNVLGAGIDYKVNIGVAGTYTVEIRYAATNDRPANLIQNGTIVAQGINLPSSGEWTTYITATVTAYLSAGTSDLRLEATSSNGLPNIDYLKLSGENISVADCNSTETVSYTLSVSTSGSGSVSPSGGTFEAGTSVTLTATPASGWKFDSWSTGATSNPLTLILGSELAITAVFTEIVGTISTIRIQENETGFCSVDGSIDNNNSGFTGDGFANTINASGNGIDWAVDFGSSGTYTFAFSYASASDRPANLIVNGELVASNINFPSTGSWTTWSSVSATGSIMAGSYDVRLEAINSDGLANIDYMEITGVDPKAYDCNYLKSASTALAQLPEGNLKGYGVYPNPSSGSVSIRFNLETSSVISIKLFDMTGKIIDVISEEQYHAGENVIDYNNENLKAGLYVMSIHSNFCAETFKLIIQ